MNSNEIKPTYFQQDQTSQVPTIVQQPAQSVLPVIIILLLLLPVFAFGGYYLGKTSLSTPATGMEVANTPTQILTPDVTRVVIPSPTEAITPSLTTLPKVSLKTYTSAFERLRFQYPSDWQPTAASLESNIPQADTFTIKSPSGKIKISWISAIDGLGGGCDDTIPPGTEGACPLYEVIEKEKLKNADLYFVSYIVTLDNKKFYPVYALQGSNGMLETERSLGYLLFTGKNNGKLLAGLMIGSVPYGSSTFSGTRQQAIDYLNDPEMSQAKNIFLSTSY